MIKICNECNKEISKEELKKVSSFCGKNQHYNCFVLSKNNLSYISKEAIKYNEITEEYFLSLSLDERKKIVNQYYFKSITNK